MDGDLEETNDENTENLQSNQQEQETSQAFDLPNVVVIDTSTALVGQIAFL